MQSIAVDATDRRSITDEHQPSAGNLEVVA